MKNLLFSNGSCRHCHSTLPVSELRALRTATHDTCLTCGRVLMDFAALGLAPAAAPKDTCDNLPQPIAALLENLLQRRLLRVTTEVSPRTASRPDFGVVQKSPVVYKNGRRLFMHLVGPGNCFLQLRWKYSNQPAPAPAEPAEAPDLRSVKAALPARVSRAAAVLQQALQFTGLHFELPQKFYRSLRFEATIALPVEDRDGTNDYVAVQAELGWYQVGTSFPLDDGERKYRFQVCSDHAPRGGLLTFDEALDQAIAAVTDTGGYTRKATICDSTTAQVMLELNERSLRDELNPRFPWQDRQVFVALRGYAPDGVLYEGAVPVKGQGVLSCEIGYELSIDNHAHRVVCARFNGQELIRQNLGLGTTVYNLGKVLGNEPGFLQIVIGEGAAAIEAQYRLVPQKQYEREWVQFHANTLQAFKIRQLLAQEKRLAQSRGAEAAPLAMTPGDAVAVQLTSARVWLEAEYDRQTPVGTHVVRIRHHDLTEVWEVVSCLPLHTALVRGLTVTPQARTRVVPRARFAEVLKSACEPPNSASSALPEGPAKLLGYC